jgi:adenylate cyclase class 2
MKKTEIELKFPLKNKDAVMLFLNNVSKQEKEQSQKDTYFIPSHRNFLKADPVKEWFRIRESGKGSEINYKNWHHTKSDREAVSCDEFETQIQDVEAMRAILTSLDFKKIVIVDKKRINFKYKDTIISIDSISDLGDFIEIEADRDFNTIEEAKRHLHSILKEIKADVGEELFRGYPQLLLEKKFANT